MPIHAVNVSGSARNSENVLVPESFAPAEPLFNRRLPCAPFPVDGEGLLGYRLRLADLNKYPRTSWITTGPIKQTMMLAGDQPIYSGPLKRIAELTGYPAGDLARALLWPSAIPLRFFNLSRPRLCPRCLDEFGYLQRIWDLSLVACCPIHTLNLLDKCPACQKPLRWNRKTVFHCSCGFDFRLAKAEPVHPTTAYLTKAFTVAANAGRSNIDEEQQNLDLQDSFPSLDMPITELGLSIMYIGGLSISGSTKHAFMKPKTIQLDEALKLMEHAAHVLQDWPNAFHSLLARVATRNNDAQANSVARTFGHMYKYLYNAHPSRYLAFLREQFEVYLRDQWVGLLSKDKMSLFAKSTFENSRYVSSAVVRQKLGFMTPRTKRLVKSGHLPGVILSLKSGRSLVLVERSALKELSHIYQDMMTFREARSDLGLNRWRMHELIDGGILEANKSSIFVAGGVWHIKKSQVSQLRSTLLDHLPQIDDSQISTDLISLSDLLRFRVNRAGQFPALVNAMLVQKLIPVGCRKDCPDLRGILFKMDDALMFLAQVSFDRDYASIDDCAKTLGLNKRWVYGLTKTKLLKSQIRRRGHQSITIVSTREIERFKTRYVTADELAKRFGGTRNSINKTLKSQGLKPITITSTGGPKQNFYLRKRATKLLLSFRESPS